MDIAVFLIGCFSLVSSAAIWNSGRKLLAKLLMCLLTGAVFVFLLSVFTGGLIPVNIVNIMLTGTLGAAGVIIIAGIMMF